MLNSKRGFIEQKTPKTKVYSVSSGKGGVGKSVLCGNLAYCLGQEGNRVLLLDGDTGLANLDLVFGVRPQATLRDFLLGKKSLNDIIIPVSKNVDLLPGGRGVLEFSKVAALHRQYLVDQVGELDHIYDVMLIDTASGIEEDVIFMNATAHSVTIVLTNDGLSLADAYSLIKVLNQRTRRDRFSVICNKVESEEEGLDLYSRFQSVVSQFLHVGLDYMGSVNFDTNLKRMSQKRTLISKEHAQSISSQSFRQLSRKMSEIQDFGSCRDGIHFFWQGLLQNSRVSLVD